MNFLEKSKVRDDVKNCKKMKIKKIQIKNYRLLKNFSLDLEDKLSLIVGKNNCGKTSLLTVMDKFLNPPNKHPFNFQDFNLDFREEILKLIDADTPNPDTFEPLGIYLNILIQYEDTDSLKNVSKLMMDLDPDNNQIKLVFEYVLTYEELIKLKSNYLKFKHKETQKNTANHEYEIKSLDYFLKNNYKEYFKLFKKTVDIKDEKNFKDLEKEKISLKEVLNLKFIKANRDVSNDNNKSLSSLSSDIYEQIEKDNQHQDEIESFKDEIHKSDKILSKSYENIFKSVIEKVRIFGGIKKDESKILIESTLQHKDLLKDNTTVFYNHGDSNLPEEYNGLGYMNLINMIFEIEIKLKEFNRKQDEQPADLNIFFIEEPEAHTHPQMQYIFIKNIKRILFDEPFIKNKLQCIVSTHSSHIVSESDFNDIKYLKRKNDKSSVSASNLKDLEQEYEDDRESQNYKFLKQYLTLHRSELFFADKAIFIEGDTERILLPAMMKKIDQEVDTGTPLLSQNISIIETGAYSHIFEKFIDFIGIKSLIITDIDSARTREQMDELKNAELDPILKNKIKQKVRVSDEDATITTNESLKFFYDESGNLATFKDKEIEELILKKNPETKKWIKDENGFLVCVYQIKEKNSSDIKYHARSFEDAFFHINHQFILDDENNAFEGITGDDKKGLKKLSDFSDSSKDAYYLAKNCVNRKPALAIEILLNSNNDADGKEFSNWKTPEYIKQGLLWLKE